MTATGIKILDKSDHISPTLADILEEVENGEMYNWVILTVDGVLNQGYDAQELGIDEKINDSENGMRIAWDQLVLFSDVFYQMWEVIVLGSKNPDYLRYKGREKSIYTTCDFVLELVDCSYWEVFSKDSGFLERLKSKFQDTEPLDFPWVQSTTN